MEREPGSKGKIDNEYKTFNTKRVSNKILKTVNDAVDLFKKTNESDIFFDNETFEKLNKEIDRTPPDTETFNNAFVKAKAKMTPENRDRFAVTISIMRNLYNNAPSDTKQGELRVAKDDLVGFFGGFIF